MQIRFQNSPGEVKQMDTEQLRGNFLCSELINEDQLRLVYSHYDRVIIGGAKPVNETIALGNQAELKADYFLERREIGIINVGGTGAVIVGNTEYRLGNLDCLYIGKGNADVQFTSTTKNEPAVFFMLSAPAHAVCETRKMSKEEASPVQLGDQSTSNKRTIYKYIHADGIKSCQLVMGLTILEPGSVWNSVPPHTHTRRMEVYFYFNLPAEQRVMHFMGEPQQTRHIVVANHQAVISAPWSVHFGCGTSNYGFIWGMAGENYTFSDMDPVAVNSIK